jgi:hypothetical protein
MTACLEDILAREVFSRDREERSVERELMCLVLGSEEEERS